MLQFSESCAARREFKGQQNRGKQDWEPSERTSASERGSERGLGFQRFFRGFSEVFTGFQSFLRGFQRFLRGFQRSSQRASQRQISSQRLSVLFAPNRVAPWNFLQAAEVALQHSLFLCSTDGKLHCNIDKAALQESGAFLLLSCGFSGSHVFGPPEYFRTCWGISRVQRIFGRFLQTHKKAPFLRVFFLVARPCEFSNHAILSLYHGSGNDYTINSPTIKLMCNWCACNWILIPRALLSCNCLSVIS